MNKAISLSSIPDALLEKMTLEEKAHVEIYFSISEEDELVVNTLNILKDAK